MQLNNYKQQPKKIKGTKRTTILGVGIFVDLSAVYVVIVEDFIVLVNSTKEIPDNPEPIKVRSVEKLPLNSKKLIKYLQKIEESEPDADIYNYINYQKLHEEVSPYFICRLNEELFLDSESDKLKKEIIQLKLKISDGDLLINNTEILKALEGFDMKEPDPIVLALILGLQAVTDINHMLYIFG